MKYQVFWIDDLPGNRGIVRLSRFKLFCQAWKFAKKYQSEVIPLAYAK